MKFFRSIRWRLQLWYGVLLLLILAGFGLSAWRLQTTNQMGKVDQELEQRMGIVSDMIRARNGPPPNHPPAGGPPGANRPPPSDWKLPERKAGLFENIPGRTYYYIVWHRNGEEIVRSTFAPPDVPQPERLHGPPEFRTRGTLRECYHDTPSGECLLVGRDIGEEQAGAAHFAWLLAGVGIAVLVLGLAGGGWVAARALRPISDISEAAERISAGDLSQRVRTADTDSELGQLARVLNDTFARLQGAFARQSQFTADASHELRTPISVVLTQTQSTLVRERPASEYKECLEACQRAAQRMRAILENLLMLARLDSAKAPEETGVCDLSLIAKETMEILETMAGEHNVRMESSLSPAYCRGNAGQLAQAVQNLASNAIHYNHPGGSIHITVENEPGTAVLSVSDTGPGISSTDLPHIFERFYRVDKARSGAQGHSGLGLAIARAIVEHHGGTITVGSEPGKGSTFQIRLPEAPAPIKTGDPA